MTWLFFGALLWGSMIHQHTRRWMWRGSASVVSWNWEKYSCHSKLVLTDRIFRGAETDSKLRINSESWYWRRKLPRQGSNPRYSDNKADALLLSYTSQPLRNVGKTAIFDSHEKCDSMQWSVLHRPAECPYVAKTLTLRFSRTLYIW